MKPGNVYKKTAQHLTDLFTNNKNPSLVFHNLDHTISVVARTKEIEAHYHLGKKDMLIVYVAAWFHDTSCLFSDAEHHEEKSAVLMPDFMKKHSQDEGFLYKI
jgi:predicted metal-dependent HD superfamily phosphohydrolase